ncbi:MAG: hypothetical protein NW200_14215 [Hyphomonadaceae bacterium]|nr:hypothetical protein [Hyphomonadaceae bacterium]
MQLFPHEGVDNYFREVDGRALDREACNRIATQYEDGDAILLTHIRPDYDAAFLEALHWPADAILKKLKGAPLPEVHDAVLRGKIPQINPDAPRNSPHDQYQRLLTQVFNGDTGKLAYFIQQIASVNAFLENLGRTIFPKYKILKRSITWRMSDTINENLHIDVYNEDLPDHHLRFFVNLDTTWRIWHTSHRLDWLVRNHMHRLPADFLATATPGRICHRLNFDVFGGFEQAGREGMPKHIAFFGPGEVWLVDSRKVSHQIFFGRRAVSTELQVDVKTMLDPAKHYLNVVSDLRLAA